MPLINKPAKYVDLTGREALNALSSDVRLAVELYTNPMYPETFGVLSRSAAVAGVSRNAMTHPTTKAAILYMQEMRDKQSEKVAAVLSRYSMDAAHRLISMLGADVVERPDGTTAPLRVLDPTEAIESGEHKKARAITDHNKAVANVVREVRQVIALILGYHLGPPGEQSSGPGSEARDPLDLGSLSTEELRELARHVEEVRVEKEQAATSVIVVDEQKKGEGSP